MGKRICRVDAEFHERLEARQGLRRDRYVELFEDFYGPAGTTLPAWLATHDDSAAGSPTLDYDDDAQGGQYVLQLATDNELERITLYGGDQLIIDATKGPIFEARVKIEADVTGAGGALGASDVIVLGLGSARNDTLDSVAGHAWFRMEGANNNVLVETDDGTTDDDDNDTGADWTDGSFHVYRIDMSDLSNIKFSVDGVVYQVLAAAALTGNLQVLVEVHKAAAANMDHKVTVDYVHVAYQR